MKIPHLKRLFSASNKTFSYILATVFLVSQCLNLFNFGSIKAEAASPGPFWSWNGSGTPTKIQNSENFDSIDVGGAFFIQADLAEFYIATEGANTYVWGNNIYRQLGTGDAVSLTVPTLAPALSNLVEVSSGWYSSLGIKNDGSVIVWGGGFTNPPAQVTGVNNAVDVYMNGYNNGLIADSSGNVYSVNSDPNSAILVPGLSNIVEVSSGFESRYALDSLGQLWAWGGNTYGQLGNGTLNANQTPSIVQGLPQIKSISSGADNIMALDVNGDVWAWGNASNNQVGQGETQPNQTTPLKVLGLPPIKEIAMNGKSPKAIDFNQKVWEWGQNRTGGQSNIPTNITSPANINQNMLADSGTLKSNGRITVAKRDLIVQAVLRITQSASQNNVEAGDSLTYTINYQNTGTATATGVVITNDLLPDLSFVSCTGSCSNSGQNITWNLPNIPAGSSGSVSFTANVSASVAIGKLSNTVLISSTNAESNSEVLSVDVLAPATPGLNINKTADQSSVSEYSSLMYSIQYSNTLPTSVDNVIITDTLDPRLSISSLPGSCSNSNQDITCNLGTLNPGDSGVLEIYVNVNQGAAGGPLANTAIIDSDQTEPKAVGNVISVNNPSVYNPDLNQYQPLSFNKSVDKASAFAGDTLYYTIEVSNPNSDGAYVTIQDVLDPRLNYNYDCSYSCSDSSSSMNQALEWSFYISSGSSETLTYSAYLDGNAAPGDLWNTAIIEYYDNNSDYDGSKSSSVKTLINGDEFDDNGNTPPSPDFSLSKTASVSQASPGDTFDYTIVVTSGGYEGNISFLDILDPRLDFVSCNNCNANGQQLTFSDYLGSNNTNTYTITVQVKNQVAGGPLANTAFITRDGISWNNNTGDQETKASTSIIQIVVPPASASLQISKTSSQAVVERGDLYTYTLNYANIGSSASSNTIVTDVLDPRLTFVSCSNSCTQNGQNLSWNLASVGAGSVGNITVEVTVNNDAAPGILANTAQIDSDQTNPITGITYIRIEQPLPSTTIEVIKTANKTDALPGEQIVYTINYKNNGNVDQTGAVITDILDSDLNFVSCSSSCVNNGQTVTWNLGSLASGTDTIVTVTAEVKSSAVSGNLPNTAIFKTNETDEVSSTANVNIDLPVNLPIVLDKIASQPNVNPNTTYTYAINYENPNAFSLSNVVIDDVLDTRLDFISCSNSCTQTGQNVSWEIPTLAANASGSVVITVRVKNNAATGTLINTALAEATNTAQSSDSVSINVDQPVALIPLIISKTSSQNNVNRNSTYTYTINYQNPNNGPLTDITIDDVLDTRLDFISCSNSCTQTGQNVSWEIPTLAANASGSVTITVSVVNQAAYGILANTAVIDSAETTGSSAINFVSVIPISVVAVPTIIKTQDLSTAYRGDTIIYTINFSNNSDVNFSNAVITDNLNSNLDFVSCSNSCTQTGQTITWNIGNLAIGNSGSVAVTAQIRTDATLGLLTNNALLSTLEAPTVDSSSYGAIIINDPTPQPSLTLNKTASSLTLNRGDTYTYNLDYTNGPVAVTNAVISDTLNNNLNFISCSNSCVQIGQDITWNLGDLAANATGTVSVTVQVKPDATLGNISNTATISSGQTTSQSSTISISVIVNLGTPTLKVTKTSSNDIRAPGENITYTIDYENTANLPVTGAIITDVLDSRLDFVSCTGGCLQNGQDITWNLGDLADEAFGSVSITVTVDSFSTTGLINNTAIFDSNETASSSSLAAVAIIENPISSLNISQIASSTSVYPGETFSYNLTYLNGNLPVTNAILGTTLDSRLEFVSCTTSCLNVGQNVDWSLGNLNPANTGSIVLTVRVRDNAFVGSLDNVVTIDSVETSPSQSTERVAIIVDPQAPYLKVDGTASPDKAKRGDTVTFTINYENPSTTALSGATLTVPVNSSSFTYLNNNSISALSSSDISYQACSGNCNFSGGNITWNLGNLSPGQIGSVTFTVEVRTTAAIGLIEAGLNISSNQTSPVIGKAGLAIVEDIPARINLSSNASNSTLTPGSNFSYNLTYQNTGVAVTSGVVSTTLDSNLDFVSCSASCTQAGQTLTWNLGSLSENQSGVLNISVNVRNSTPAGAIDNLFSVTSTETPTPVTSLTTVAILDNSGFSGDPRLDISVTSTESFVERGRLFSYQIDYRNTSGQTITESFIKNTLDKRLKLFNCFECTVNGSTLNWSLGTLSVGQSGTLSYQVQVLDDATLGILSNVAIFGSNQIRPAGNSTDIVIRPTGIPIETIRTGGYDGLLSSTPNSSSKTPSWGILYVLFLVMLVLLFTIIEILYFLDNRIRAQD